MSRTKKALALIALTVAIAGAVAAPATADQHRPVSVNATTADHRAPVTEGIADGDSHRP